MSVQVIEQALGQHANLVTIEAKSDRFIIKMKRREDKDTWQAIADTVKKLGGIWVYGQNSHGEIPFKPKTMKLTAKGHIAIIEGELEWLKKFLTEELK